MIVARFEKVLVCIDGSESSRKAADYAVMLAKQNGSQLISLHVIVSQLGYAYSTGAFGLVTPNTINDMLEKSKQEAQEWFDNIGKKRSDKWGQIHHRGSCKSYFDSSGDSRLCREHQS